MFISVPLRGLILLAGFLAAASVHAAGLTLAEAERIAVERDAERARLLEEAGAARERSVAASALPDPELRAGFANLPVDSFALDQEPMTQTVVGFRQVLPPGDAREARRERGEAFAETLRRAADERALAVRKALRRAWFEYLAADAQLLLTRDTRADVEPLLASAEARYRSGRGRQADYLTARLKLDRLEDARLQAEERRDAARAELLRWLGEWPQAGLAGSLETAIFEYPRNIAAARARLDEHPALAAADARIQAGKAGEAEAEGRYGPQWSFDLSYGDRRGVDMTGIERPDFVSAMVSVSLPLFTKNRQDRELGAARRETLAATHARTDLLRRMQGELDAAWSRFEDTREQLVLYEESLAPVAQSALESNKQAYANDVVRLDDVVSARLDLYQVRFRILELGKRLQQLRAELAYFAASGAAGVQP